MHTGTRDSQAELLLGVDGWVQHKEGGVLYSLDVTKCMFSSGNTTVRQRMGQLDCRGETVLDLYAGIGYYTLPFLVKAGEPLAATADVMSENDTQDCSPGILNSGRLLLSSKPKVHLQVPHVKTTGS